MDFLTPQLFLNPMVAWVYPVSTPDHYGKAAKKRMQISELHFTCHLHFVCCRFLFVGCFGSDIFICASHPPVLVRAKSVVTTLSRYDVVNVGSQCFRLRTRYRRRTRRMAKTPRTRTRTRTRRMAMTPRTRTMARARARAVAQSPTGRALRTALGAISAVSAWTQ